MEINLTSPNIFSLFGKIFYTVGLNSLFFSLVAKTHFFTPFYPFRALYMLACAIPQKSLQVNVVFLFFSPFLCARAGASRCPLFPGSWLQTVTGNNLI
jgi:hypothetical protein